MFNFTVGDLLDAGMGTSPDRRQRIRARPSSPVGRMRQLTSPKKKKTKKKKTKKKKKTQQKKKKKKKKKKTTKKKKKKRKK